MAIRIAGATQLGGLNTLIAVDTQTVYKAIPTGHALDTNLTAAKIGGGTHTLEDPRYPGKALQFRQAAAAVANDALLTTGWYNRTGKALVSGDIIVAVAA